MSDTGNDGPTSSRLAPGASENNGIRRDGKRRKARKKSKAGATPGFQAKTEQGTNNETGDSGTQGRARNRTLRKGRARKRREIKTDDDPSRQSGQRARRSSVETANLGDGAAQGANPPVEGGFAGRAHTGELGDQARKSSRKRGRKRTQRRAERGAIERDEAPRQKSSNHRKRQHESQEAALANRPAQSGAARSNAASLKGDAGARVEVLRERAASSFKESGARGANTESRGQVTSRRISQPPSRDSKLYAALDLGTNNCRLLVARPEDRGFRVVDAFSRIVRLGEGLGATNKLCPAAMDRAIGALAMCREKLDYRGVARTRLIATEACRAAVNGDSFIKRVEAETGLSLEVVSRETEARLAVAGCASLVDPEADGVVLFDIGGGSSEIVWLDLRNRCGARGYALTRFIRTWISLPVGVVNLAERHGGMHVTRRSFEAMVDDAAGYLEDFTHDAELVQAISSGQVHMLGTSGTVTTLAGVHFGLKRYDRRRVDGAWMDDRDVSAMIERLRSMPYEERVDNPCIGADRADLVLAGCAILEAIRRRWPCRKLRVADRGLREGILMEMMASDDVWRRKRSIRPGA